MKHALFICGLVALAWYDISHWRIVFPSHTKEGIAKEYRIYETPASTRLLGHGYEVWRKNWRIGWWRDLTEAEQYIENVSQSDAETYAAREHKHPIGKRIK